MNLKHWQWPFSEQDHKNQDHNVLGAIPMIRDTLGGLQSTPELFCLYNSFTTMLLEAKVIFKRAILGFKRHFLSFSVQNSVRKVPKKYDVLFEWPLKIKKSIFCSDYFPRHYVIPICLICPYEKGLFSEPEIFYRSSWMLPLILSRGVCFKTNIYLIFSS